MAVIEVRQLSKRYGAVTAVDQLSFQIGAGTVTGFLGPNGAGKTTTLRMLLGLTRPDSGHATIWGRRYAELGDRRRAVGAVLEASGFHPGRTMRDHLRVRCAATGISRSRADAALEITGLGGLAVTELASGRLEITGADTEQVATLAAARGLPIFEISEQSGSLEDAFLKLTAAERRPG
jgi:ABC-2 type transport system ATP-binding protein